MGNVVPIDHYRLAQRRAPRSRLATCAEVECDGYRHGFQLRVDESTELGQRQAYYLRRDTSRTKPIEVREGGLTVFRYPPGQRCTASQSPEHWIAVDQFFIARGSSVRPVEWVERFGENQQAIADRIARG